MLRLHNELFIGDALDVLKTLPSNCVQCCVTSPPYWGLRDYGTRRWFGGDSACEHDRTIEHGPHHPGAVEQTKWKKSGVEAGGLATTASCSKCGAWWGQLGLEPTPKLYVRNMVEVFREVRRVLRADGTLWLNLGDSYSYAATIGLPPKNLLMIPSRVAIALQDDGWILRQDIVWHKPNPMPERVTDRPTRSHEFIFLLAKSARYFYDAAAIREPFVTPGGRDGSTKPRERNRGGRTDGYTTPNGIDPSHNGGRNKRDVWTIVPGRFKGAHFAVFPPGLPEVCIKAGSKPGDLVLDPFAGSGTTLAVARERGRDFVGIEINQEYASLILDRVCAIPQDAAPKLLAVGTAGNGFQIVIRKDGSAGAAVDLGGQRRWLVEPSHRPAADVIAEARRLAA